VNFWAPEIVLGNDGFYYMHVSGLMENGLSGIAVARSTSIDGIYEDVVGHAITNPDWSCIDGHVFTDTNGSEYLLFSRFTESTITEIYVQRIEDYSVLVGDPIFLFKGYDARWTTACVEGPFALYLDGIYYVFFSSYSTNWYSVGYATSERLAGPYEQRPGPIIYNDAGHASHFMKGGEHWLSYHQPNDLELIPNIEHPKFSRMYLSGGVWIVEDVKPVIAQFWWVVIASIAGFGIIALSMTSMMLSRRANGLPDAVPRFG